MVEKNNVHGVKKEGEMGSGIQYSEEERDWGKEVVKRLNGKVSKKKLMEAGVYEEFKLKFERTPPVGGFANWMNRLRKQMYGDSLRRGLKHGPKRGPKRDLKLASIQDGEFTLRIRDGYFSGFESPEAIQDFLKEYKGAGQINIFKQVM